MIIAKLYKKIKDKDLLQDISFSLNDGNKVGLIGDNGSGKTTLLKILAGIITPDSGEIKLNNQTIKYLQQEIETKFYNFSIIDYVKNDIGILELEQKINKLEKELTDKNMEEYTEVLDKYLKLDGYNFENNLQIVMQKLMLNINYNRKIGTLSGGEKIKVSLACLLLSNADILLLDEPTNNLDIKAIEALEEFIIRSSQRMIIVSHDETFLNNTVNKIFLLKNGTLTEYNTEYKEYLQLKENEYNTQLEQYNRAIEEKVKIKKQINQTKQWTEKGISRRRTDHDKLSANYSKERTKKTSSKITKLKKQFDSVKIDKTFLKKEKINFSIDYDDVKGNKNIFLSHVICGYEDGFRTPSLTIEIPFGSRININGRNGSGKTTLIETIIGKHEPLDGSIIIGNSVKIGYISQNSIDDIDPECSVYQYLTKGINIDRSQLFNVLSKFQIDYSDKDKAFITLSPGQRTKINLAKLALNEVNVLILDEATNHLDVSAIQILKEAIETFNGTIINISHNRSFKEALNADIEFNIETGDITYETSSIKQKKYK